MEISNPHFDIKFRVFPPCAADSVPRHNAKQWSLKALPVDLLGVKPRSIAMVTLRNRSVSPVVQVFIEHLRSVAGSMFAPARSG